MQTKKNMLNMLTIFGKKLYNFPLITQTIMKLTRLINLVFTLFD